MARLYGLGLLDAAKMILNDFGLNWDTSKPLTAKQKAEIQHRKKMNRVDRVFRLAIDQAYITLCDVRIKCCQIIDKTGPFGGFRYSHIPDMIDLLLDVLQYGKDAEKLEILKNKEVERWSKLLQ